MSSNIRIERICQLCHKSFIAKTLVTKFCSHKCSSRAHKIRTRSAYIDTVTPVAALPAADPLPSKVYDYLELAEAASEMRISVRTLFRLMAAKKIKTKKILSRTVILRKDIKLFFNQQ